MLPERRYTEEDLAGLKKEDLLNLVRRQRQHWPAHIKFNSSKTNVGELRKNLLSYAFTKEGSYEAEDPLALNSGAQDVMAAREEPRGEPSGQATTAKPQIISADALTTKENLIAALEGLNVPQPVMSKNPEERQIRLLIEDRRATFAENGFARTSVLITLFPRLLHDNGDWDFRIKDMLRKLQHSNAAIDGTVKLSYPDPVEPTYNHIFVKMTKDHVPLEDVPSDPTLFTMPSSSSSVKIIVEHAKNQYDPLPSFGQHGHASTTIDLTTDGTQQYPLVRAKQRAEDIAQREAQWLKDRVSTRPGYIQFCDNKNRKLKNSDRVKFWLFVASFSCDLYHAPSPIRSNKKVTKIDIRDALDIQQTALSEAETAARIIRVYGSGGVQESAEVIEMLNKDEVIGSGVLYRFLTEWEKNHTSS